MTEYRVRDIMRTDMPRFTPATPIRRAVAELVAQKAAAAPVLAPDGTLVGILTQKDCFGPALHASYHREWTGQVADRMSRNVVTVDAEDAVIHVAEMFLTHPHRVFPVLQDTRVAGMVRRSDVLALLVRMG